MSQLAVVHACYVVSDSSGFNDNHRDDGSGTSVTLTFYNRSVMTKIRFIL